MSAPSNPPPGPRADAFLWEVPAPEPEPRAPEPQRPGRSRSGLLAIAAIVVALALGITAMVALSGGDDAAPEASGECEAGQDCGAGEQPSLEPREMEIPDGHMGVRSLGALTPIPEEGWSPYAGPGADELLAEDAHAVFVSHTDRWISYLMVGRLGEFGLEAEPEDLSATATEIVETWVFDYPYSGTTGLAMSDPVLTDTTVDSQPAVLLETRVTWDSLDSSPDTYEDVALLLVDPGEGGIFLGVAAVPESGTHRFERAVDALMATTFQHNTYVP